MTTGSSKELRTRQGTKPDNKQTYRFRVFRTDRTFATVTGTLSSPTSELAAAVGKKFLIPIGPNYRIFLVEKGIERVMGQMERPIALMRKRLEQAGYEEEDRFDELGREDHSYLTKFIFKPDTTQTFSGASFEQPGKTEYVDLYGKGMETPPIFFYKCAANIISLNLGKNPGLDLPSDFVQLCINLHELNLSQNGMKRIPQGIKFATGLTRLDVSNNNLSELDHVQLYELKELRTLKLHNNNLRDLPKYFVRLEGLKFINLSNNRFETFPPVLCEMINLVELDISFNEIGSIPDEIGNLQNLERLTILSNRLTSIPASFAKLEKLEVLDCRRNSIANVSFLSNLPSLRKVQIEHNPITSFDIHLPSLRELSACRISTINFSLASKAENLTQLNLSWSKMGGLHPELFEMTPALETLVLDYNNLKSLPDSVNRLSKLVHLSFKSNQVETVPKTIYTLPRLQCLDASTNKIESLPNEVWLCPMLKTILLSSNRLHEWPLTPMAPILDPKDETKSKPRNPNKPPSSGNQRVPMPLSLVLRKLSLADNHFTETDLPLHLLPELVVLNLSFNELSELPSLGRLTKLQELYLSGNKLKSLPREDIEKLENLIVLHVNGNQLHDLPAELGKIKGLSVLDAGNNELRYNIANWPYDWNWNYNPELCYLNLSGNKRLEIKPSSNTLISDPAPGGGRKRNLADFSSLTELVSLGLMDVTHTAASIPDEAEDRRVRTSLSEINDMAYGISDSIRPGEQLTVLDLVVPKFRSREDEAVFGMFDASSASSGGARLIKYMLDCYAATLIFELSRLKGDEMTSEALRRSFMSINRDFGNILVSITPDSATNKRKNSEASVLPTVAAAAGTGASNPHHARAGASGIVIYVRKKTLYVAHCGGCLAVISRRTGPERLCEKHDPFEPKEVARIRKSEGWISPDGTVMPDPSGTADEIRVSRSFGFYHISPVVSAAPDVLMIELAPTDEFIILANQTFWDHVHYKHAVDIAKSERRDPMLAAAKLRDVAISYGASSAVMVMVIAVADLFKEKSFNSALSRGPSLNRDGYYGAHQVSRRRGQGTRLLEEKVQAPEGWVALVFTDIRNSTMLWDTNEGTHLALRMHNDLLRYFLDQFGGYEVKTEGDAFMVAFRSPISALLWCLTVQLKLLKEEWPQQILNSEEGKEVYGPRGELLYRGLSIRMGIHWGQPFCEIDPVTKRMDYYGPMVNKSSRISGKAEGGEITISKDALDYVRSKCFPLADRDSLRMSRFANSSGSHGESPTNPAPDSSSSSQFDLFEQKDVEAIKSIGFGIHEMGEVKLKGLEQKEIITILYPKELANRIPQVAALENGDTISDEVVFEPSMDRLFRYDEIVDLARLVLRLEKVTSTLCRRDTSTELSTPLSPGGSDSSHLLMLHISPDASDSDFEVYCRHFMDRIENCVSTLALNRMANGQDILSILGQALNSTVSLLDMILSVFSPECA
ncbi:L domain-like protein [Atractiella rhizophila]|nr:L domain-like protein [Atractiella rhizophila]